MSDLPLRIYLAGFNLDTDTLRELQEAARGRGTAPPEEAITPETLSAAYARISRNPAPVNELRQAARKEVAKARKSNESIIFGLGHASVAEHACFNFDVINLSRLAVEAVQHHRLASFTEKSQRYIKLDKDYVVPAEIVEVGMRDEFESLVAAQNETYHHLFPALLDYFTELEMASGGKMEEGPAKGRAAEDARYVVSLATQAQFGMTVNARTLEILVRASLAHPLDEVRQIGRRLRAEVAELAPSLVKYTDASSHETTIHKDKTWWCQDDPGSTESVRLVDYDANGEQKVLAALLVRSRGYSFEEAMQRVRETMQSEERLELVKRALRGEKVWDPLPREFELAQFTFEITLSSTAFAQLKRHRMATLLAGPYNPALGWTLPDSIREIGKADEFHDIMALSSELACRIANDAPSAAAYALTNAHRRRVLLQANARELVHVSRLREDIHAQWDIRRIARDMIAQARQAAPALMLLAAGKHEFETTRQQLFRS